MAKIFVDWEPVAHFVYYFYGKFQIRWLILKWSLFQKLFWSSIMFIKFYFN